MEELKKQMIYEDKRIEKIVEDSLETSNIRNGVFDSYVLHTYQLYYTFEDGSEATTIVRANRPANASYMAQDNLLVDLETGETFTKAYRGNRGTVIKFSQFKITEADKQ